MRTVGDRAAPGGAPVAAGRGDSLRKVAPRVARQAHPMPRPERVPPMRVVAEGAGRLDDTDDPHFSISGRIGTLPVSASWSRDILVGDPELLERADDLVDQDYVFRLPDSPFEVRASLTDPLAAALTVIRCFDHIDRATIAVACPSGGSALVDRTMEGARPPD